MQCTFCDSGVSTPYPNGGDFCSRKCYDQAYYRKRFQKEFVCEDCKQIYLRSVKPSDLIRFKARCTSCDVKFKQVGKEGPKSRTWLGGHRGWQAGKVGRDKDGLSWKQQRQLAWERDKYTCQDCGLTKPNWRPDCHHVIPYRLSFSHTLTNLRSLCNSCHKKADAKIPELWGGFALGKLPRVAKVKARCSSCDKRKLCKNMVAGTCRHCRGLGLR